MKLIMATIGISILVSACAVRTNQYYLPTDPSLTTEGRYCGHVPYGGATISLGENIRADVSATPSGNNIGFSIQIQLPPGAKIRLLSRELTIENSGTQQKIKGRLEPFRIGVSGEGSLPGHIEYIDAGEQLEGMGRNIHLVKEDTQYLKYDQFISHTLIKTPPADSIVLEFPPIEVNGVVIEERRIPLRLITKSGLMTCVQ